GDVLVEPRLDAPEGGDEEQAVEVERRRWLRVRRRACLSPGSVRAAAVSHLRERDPDQLVELGAVLALLVLLPRSVPVDVEEHETCPPARAAARGSGGAAPCARAPPRSARRSSIRCRSSPALRAARSEGSGPCG